MGYILSYDQGTTGTTCLIIETKNFKIVDKINQEYQQIYPKPGWVEHNLNDIWNTVEKTTKTLLERNNITGPEILAIGITNQRETTCAFDKSGVPLSNAIVWQDRRTAEFCNSNKDKENFLREKTGLPLDPYFSATKMKWLLENNEKVKKAYQEKNLKFGTIDTFLLFKLSGCESFYTEASNASRTLLMDLKTCKWDSELLDFFKIDISSLPKIMDSFGSFGKTKGLSFLPDEIPITGILGDQQAALFGQAGFLKGQMKCTYGTGAFLLLNTGHDIKKSKYGLLSTVAFKNEGKAVYALEGSCYIAGAAVQWLRDNLKIISKSSEVEELALGVKHHQEMEHILFFPFFTGIGSPYWNSNAKGAIIGLTRDTKESHLAHACLDGIAFSINDVIEAMRKDASLDITELNVDGGAVNNNLLMSIQATVSNLKIIRPKVVETTGYGAALAAGIGAKILTFEKIHSLWEKDMEFSAFSHLRDYYQRKTVQWKDLIKKLYS
ncbi:MAG: glycerol kinase GlpK [Bacteriovoracales bacterium]